MTDTQVKDETELTDFDGDEVMYVVDDPTGTPVDRKAQIRNFGRHYGWLRRSVYVFDDFLSFPGTTGTGWTTTGSGTGSGWSSSTPGSDNVFGVGSMSTGTTTTGRAALGFVPNAFGTAQRIRLGLGQTRCRFRLKLSALSDGTDTYTARVGFIDTGSGSENTNGVFFRYTHGTNGGEWQAVSISASGGAETATDTNVAGSTSFATFEIVINAGATQALFYIDNVLVATHTTDIPTSSEPTNCGASIVKSAGTTARTLDFDYAEFEARLTTVR